MPFTVTFTDFTPAARFDGISWVQVLIEESATKDGTYNQIDVKNFTPDPDPRNPATHSFTTEEATLEAGWYRLVWVDGTGDEQQPTLTIFNGLERSDFFKPTIKEVANEILSRTRDENGALIGTFTDGTTPTDDKVAEIIDQAADEVESIIDDDIPESIWDSARQVIAILAAMQIETSFYSDQMRTGRSAYPQLKERYDAALASLITGVAREQEEEESGETTLTPMMPRGAFPEAQPWLTRRL